MNLSVIICTYNRSRELRQTLESLLGSQLSHEIEREIVLVDNNSTDNTRQICCTFQDRLPLVYIDEPEQGKSFALNAGIQQARGELILFTDDDIEADSNWLEAMWNAYRRYPGRYFFGGSVLPLWETTPPKWVQENFVQLPVVFPHLDWGLNEKRINPKAGELFLGGNSAFPRRIFEEQHRFQIDIGLLGGDILRGYRVGGEDTEFIRDIANNGWQGVYIPQAIVRHRHNANRYSEKSLRNLYIGSGMALVRLEPVRIQKNLIFGAPRYLWRKLLASCIRFVIARPFFSSDRWVPAERDMALVWGQILEYRQSAKRKS